MKIIDIKNNYKFVIQKLITESDDEVFTINDILAHCEKHACKTTLTHARWLLEQCAERANWGNSVFWGNAVAIEEFKKKVPKKKIGYKIGLL